MYQHCKRCGVALYTEDDRRYGLCGFRVVSCQQQFCAWLHPADTVAAHDMAGPDRDALIDEWLALGAPGTVEALFTA